MVAVRDGDWGETRGSVLYGDTFSVGNLRKFWRQMGVVECTPGHRTRHLKMVRMVNLALGTF